MATIPPVLPPGTTAGTEASVELHYLGRWWHVARGVFTTVNDLAFAFDGRTELPPVVATFAGSRVPEALKIEVILLADREATSGRAAVKLNELKDQDASFVVEGGRYTLNANLGGAYTLTFVRIEEGTGIRFGDYELRLVR